MRKFAILFSAAVCLSQVFCTKGIAQEPVIIRSFQTIDVFPKTERRVAKVPIITGLDLDTTGNRLAFGGDDHKVRLWDIIRQRRTELADNIDWVRDVSFSPDNRKLIAIGQDGEVKIWDLEQRNSIEIKLAETIRGSASVTFSPDGTFFVICGYENEILSYRTADGKLLKRLETPGTSNRTVVFSPDGAMLAVAGLSGTVRVWNTKDYSKKFDLDTGSRRVNALAFRADGQKLATGGENPNIQLWDMQTGNMDTILPERPGKTFSLVFCGDGFLASGESDNAIRIWDLNNAECTACLIGHTGTVASMAFDEKEGKLISGSFDTTIRSWKLK